MRVGLLRRALVVVVAVSAAGAAVGCSGTPPEELLIYNAQHESLTKEWIEEFTQETGIAVNYEVYDSNELLAAKLLVGNSGYDLVVPSSSSLPSSSHQPV